jgi:hypothetical protein
MDIRRKLATEEPKRAAGAAAGEIPTAATEARPAGASRGPARRSSSPSAPLPAEDLEFAEEDTGKHAVRPVPIRDHVDIQKRLEELRDMATGRSPRTPSFTGVDRRLQDILLPDRDSRPEVKRKVSLDVPANLLKTSPSLRLHLGFEGDAGEAMIRDAVTVRLSGNKRLDRLTLHLDLELKGKA